MDQLSDITLKISPPDLRELLQQQERAIEGMTRMLNALLDISRLESGAIDPQVTNVPLVEVLHQLTTEFQSVAEARGIALRIEAVSLIFATDRTLFYQLLQNLVGNALKYTDQGEVAVTCVAGAAALTITVSDTGIGIPADKLDRIFDEYYQVDTQGAKRMGVGLGLAIVKEVARLLGFTVSVNSRVGEGTQATVSIPTQYLTAVPAGTDAASNVEPVGDLPSVLRSLRTPVPNCRFLSKPVDTTALLDAIDELSAEAGADRLRDCHDTERTASIRD